jgi:hypothetical protein
MSKRFWNNRAMEGFIFLLGFLCWMFAWTCHQHELSDTGQGPLYFTASVILYGMTVAAVIARLKQ